VGDFGRAERESRGEHDPGGKPPDKMLRDVGSFAGGLGVGHKRGYLGAVRGRNNNCGGFRYCHLRRLLPVSQRKVEKCVYSRIYLRKILSPLLLYFFFSPKIEVQNIRKYKIFLSLGIFDVDRRLSDAPRRSCTDPPGIHGCSQGPHVTTKRGFIYYQAAFRARESVSTKSIPPAERSPRSAVMRNAERKLLRSDFHHRM
jgi:hypothetical protein